MRRIYLSHPYGVALKLFWARGRFVLAMLTNVG
jgi:hypothetical protein